MSDIYYDLTTPQSNIWNVQKFYENTSIQNICGAVLYNGLLDKKLLEKAINEVIRLQDGLRLRFTEKNGSPVQYIEEYSYQDIDFVLFNSESDFNQYAKTAATKSFSLVDSQMFHFVQFELSGNSGVLVCASHLISDAWTFSILTHDVYDIYQKLAASQTVDLAKHSYLDFIKGEQDYLNSARYEKDKTFWEENCSGKLEPSHITTQHIPVSIPSAKRYTKRLTVNETSEINSFCESGSISQAVLFEAAVIAYLYRINRENNVVAIGIPVLNRSSFAEKNTVGMFISTMPLTVDVSPDDTAALLCEKITSCHSKIFRHQKYPYSHILQSLREKSNFSGNLYDVMVSYQNTKTNVSGKTYWFSNGYSETPFVMHIDNRDSTDCYTLTIDYQTELFRQYSEIAMIVDRILLIVKQIISDSTVKVDDLSMLSEGELQQVIRDFNNTFVDYPREKCVHELFSEQVKKHPDKTALVFEDKKLTYSQLDEMSNSLAHFLRSKGVRSNCVVPIIAKRDWRIIVAMIGILKAGGAYMPVDPSYPIDRVEYMLETAKSRIALVYGYFDKLSVETADLTAFDFSTDITALDNINTSNDLCYIIFTSGSTGKPKGVALRHSNVVNYSGNNRSNIVVERIAKSGYESIVSVTNIIFDIFVTESLLPLLNGLTIYFANDSQVFSQQKLSELFLHNQIDVMQTTPTKMRSYIFDKQNVSYLSKLKMLILGGEALPSDLYEEIKKYTSADVFNIYGPAETTVWSTNKLVNSNDITIDRPIANTQIYILDKNRKPLPVGAAGELCISGCGVGAGYLNRPELTAEKFVPNPFADGEIMYCTGDLACWRADGEIEYLGRIDTQVKIRGQRIELGEIESVMNTFKGIMLAAATDKRDETGRQYLVGYYTADSTIDEKALRTWLSVKLPKYMIPNYFMRLDEMPMTASGKIDRRNLPIPQLTVSGGEFVLPQNELESTLYRIVTEVLGTDKLGVTDDFFDFGGDSLRAMELVAKAHGERIEFALQSVFDHPTVRELCKVIEKGEERKLVYSAKDFEKFSEILGRNVINEDFVPEKRTLGDVLLTGATGFLGAHILDKLMKIGNSKIYCLVRGESQENACGRFLEILNFYFGDVYDGEIGKRIIPVAGNIENPDLSESIPYSVNMVIHSAATVKHYGSYDYFYKTNVLGTQNVINYAKKTRAYLCYISTLSVSGDSLYDQYGYIKSDEIKYFSEENFFISQDLSNVYVRSKFEAEKSVFDSILNGMKGSIMRVGNLTNRFSDGKFQKNYKSNAFLTRFTSFLNLRKIPQNVYGLLTDITPVDICAGAIVALLSHNIDSFSVFHINKKYNVSDVLQAFDLIDYPIETIDELSFILELRDYISKREGAELILNDLGKDGITLNYAVDTEILNKFTHFMLNRIGFVWDDPDTEYYKRYLLYLKSIGYLEV